MKAYAAVLALIAGCLLGLTACEAAEPAETSVPRKPTESIIASTESIIASTEPIMAREWTEYLSDGELPWDQPVELKLPEYPGTIFRWTAEQVTAVRGEQEDTLFYGMPILRVFLADLTGDGRPELCATTSFGSGIVDRRIEVYDYAEKRLYELADRAHFDYALSLEDGRLMVTKTVYQGTESETGALVLQAAGEDTDKLVLAMAT